MKLKSLIASIVAAFSTLAGAAQASPVWTWTIQGTIKDGYDTLGAFGAPTNNLTGSHYSQTFTVSIDPAQYKYVGPFNGSWGYNLQGNLKSPSTLALTVNGVTVTESFAPGYYAQQWIADGLSTKAGSYDEILSSSYGHDASNRVVGFYAGVWTQNSDYAFVPSLKFNQPYVIDLQHLSAHTNAQFGSGASWLYFEGDPSSITIVASDVPSNVPEPTSIALLGLGVVSMGMILRRKTK